MKAGIPVRGAALSDRADVPPDYNPILSITRPVVLRAMSESDRFLASAQVRRTDVRILEIILDLAEGDAAAADRIWAAPSEIELIDIFVALTDRGLDPESLQWDRMGVLWSRGIQEIF